MALDIFKNPYTGDKASGFDSALRELATARQGSSNGGGDKSGVGPLSDNRLDHPIMRANKTGSDDKADSKPTTKDPKKIIYDKSDNQGDKNSDKNKNPEDPREGKGEWSVSPEKLADIEKRLADIRKAARDAAHEKGGKDANAYDDVINDNNDLIDSEGNVIRKLSDSEEAEKNRENNLGGDDFTGYKARLQRIKDEPASKEFQDKAEKDLESASELVDIKTKNYKAEKERRRRRSKNYDISSELPSANIDQIKNSISQTLRAYLNNRHTTRQVDMFHIDPVRSKRRGYLTAKRYNEPKKKIPRIVLFFDVSGSQVGNHEKVKMGRMIENELRKLHNQHLIQLDPTWYFATSTDHNPNRCGGGNNDSPIPKIKELLKNKEIDNIIIMTDGNPSGGDDNIVIPGFCWLLFYDSASNYIYESVKGALGTKAYMIDHKVSVDDYDDTDISSDPLLKNRR